MLLATAWLLAQLMVAFHVGHNDSPETGKGIATLDHSCVICKLSHFDDVAVPTSFLFLLLSVALSLVVFLESHSPAFSSNLVRARAPPTA